ncbi:hypothetical protein ILYODFUR_007876 [Ilyodon furcidens]|uniref:Uncharacterized protein n=1 Tax=Ilyodon furcidens TaxID=33524 RepID=A0ABV0UE80_9TELE
MKTKEHSKQDTKNIVGMFKPGSVTLLPLTLWLCDARNNCPLRNETEKQSVEPRMSLLVQIPGQLHPRPEEQSELRRDETHHTRRGRKEEGCGSLSGRRPLMEHTHRLINTQPQSMRTTSSGLDLA